MHSRLIWKQTGHLYALFVAMTSTHLFAISALSLIFLMRQRLLKSTSRRTLLHNALFVVEHDESLYPR